MQEDFAKFQYNNRVECIAVPVKYMSTIWVIKCGIFGKQ